MDGIKVILTHRVTEQSPNIRRKQMSFTRAEIKNISDEEFNLAIKSLIDKGLIYLSIIDNKETYCVTSIGREVYSHLDSSFEDQN